MQFRQDLTRARRSLADRGKRVGYYVGQKIGDRAGGQVVAQGVIGAGSDSGYDQSALNLGNLELVKQFRMIAPESDLRLLTPRLQIDLPRVELDIEQIQPLIAAFLKVWNRRIAPEVRKPCSFPRCAQCRSA